MQPRVEEEVASYLGGGGGLGGGLGEDWAGICYVKATDIHPDIPHFTAFLFPPHSNIPHMFTLVWVGPGQCILSEVATCFRGHTHCSGVLVSVR